MQILTIACPEAFIAQGNQFSRCVGLGPDDDKTFGLPLWQDAGGNRYAVASGLVSDTFAEIATSPLVEPSWGCDMDAALAAQAMIRLGEQATPITIATHFGDANAAMAAMGLVPVPPEGGLE